MKQKAIVSLLIPLVSILNLSAQTATLPASSAITVFDKTAFFESKVSHQKLDYQNIDFELLNATLFHTINQKRKRKFRKPYRSSEALDILAMRFVNSYRGNTLRANRNRKKRFERRLQKQKRKAGFSGSYTDFLFEYLPVFNLNSNRDFYTLNGEFYYKKRNKKLQDIEKIEPHTYQTFVDEFLKRNKKIGLNNILFSKALTEFGCAFELEQRTPNKLPHLKVFLVAGGYRLGKIMEK